MLNQVKILRVLQLITLLQQNPPKTIKNLARILDNTERTVYRYLDLIKELGFDLRKDSRKRFYIIGDSKESNSVFSADESQYIRGLLENSPGNESLTSSILRKVYLQSEVSLYGNNLIHAYLGKSIESLTYAIKMEKPVILCNYHSTNTQSIEDRLVEPIKFSDDYSSICAYEPESHQNKFYKLERFTDVKIQHHDSFQYKSQHRFETPDAFGSPRLGQPISIDLLLSLRSYVLIKEEFPFTISYISQEGDKYRLQMEINNPKPVLRFVMGLLDDIIILGSNDFEEYVLNYIKKLFV